MTRIYTKTGDAGQTGLIGSGRVAKDAPRIEAYGAIDELNATLGLARAHGLDPRSDAWLAAVQNDLFVVGSALADPNPQGPYHEAVPASAISRLEGAIDAIEGELAPLTRFILPGGSRPAAHVHVARTVCRRAERRVVALGRLPGESVSPRVIVYLNRLGDFLFVLARALNQANGVADVPWEGP